MKPANPENVPTDKIPAGWRLLYEEEYRRNVPTRLWRGGDGYSAHTFSPEIHMRPDQRETFYTYITPDLPDNGQPWHAHKPGDPAPVAKGECVDIVAKNGVVLGDGYPSPNWTDCGEYGIIFYRLHEPATKPNPKTTFEAHGHTWFKHTPGDPMPCDGEAEVVLLQDNCQLGMHANVKAKEWCWNEKYITGWRYKYPERYAPPTPIAEPTVKPQPEDPVNLPTHYRSHPSGVECIEVTEHMNFCLGNAVKYLWRAGLKSSDTHLQDLRKARWYLDREITRIEKQQQP
jgi:hypothetical protein